MVILRYMVTELLSHLVTVLLEVIVGNVGKVLATDEHRSSRKEEKKFLAQRRRERREENLEKIPPVCVLRTGRRRRDAATG